MADQPKKWIFQKIASLRSKRFRAVSEQGSREKLALVSFLARPKPRILFLGLSLLQKSTETLATQAKKLLVSLTVSNNVVVTNGLLWLESTPGFC